MLSIVARNVNDAYAAALPEIARRGQRTTSRNGSVVALPFPAMIEYQRPTECVLFNAERDASPIMHFFDALWCLAGRQDVAFMEHFAARMRNYSDDGAVFHGAYGWRWRCQFGFDQLALLVEHLRKHPDSRRGVLQMWHAPLDLDMPGKDLPCNTHAYVQIVDGKLNLTICNRSNDAIFGAFGSNMVQFSFLQQYLAGMLGVPVGSYWQFTNNLHVYQEASAAAADHTKLLESQPANPLLYERGLDLWPHMVGSPATFVEELQFFLDHPNDDTTYANQFLSHVAAPMWDTHKAFKARDYDGAMQAATAIMAEDWMIAVTQWLERRAIARQQKAAVA